MIRNMVHMKARHGLLLGGLILSTVALVACGGTEPSQPTTPPNPTVVAPSQAVPTLASPIDEPTQPTTASIDAKPTQPTAAGRVTLEIGTASGATEFMYDPTTLKAPAGSKIKLKFSNKTNSKDEIGHSWVLVKAGQEESVIANAIAAGDDKDWLQEDDPGIIAHTSLIEGEQSNTITFDAPASGTYTFLCTFPEHYKGGMKGTLTIE